MKQCFVINPIGQQGTAIRQHADDVFEYIIKPAMDECGIKAFRSDHLDNPGKITEQMFKHIYSADLCIAVLTGTDPIVFYELAIAQSAQRPVILMIEKGQTLPFEFKDLNNLNTVRYDLQIRSFRERTHTKRIINHVREFEAAGWTADSPSHYIKIALDMNKPDRFIERSMKYEGPAAWLKPDTTIPQPITDDVHFTVVAPAQIMPEQHVPLDVYVHTWADVDAIVRRASREYGQPLRHRSKGPVPIQRGTIMAVRISVPSLNFEDKDLVYWTGILGNASFVLEVPAAAAVGSHAGTVDVLVDGLGIARLRFVLEVGKARGEEVDVTSAMHRVRTAFASYASQDREHVIGRIQGMQKILPDLDVFLDVVSLRSGERWEDRLREEILARDIFYLFWSEAAMKSHWVDVEWRLALQARGEHFIHPIPLAPPEIAPPPSELESKHFRDFMLFLSNRSTPAG